MNCRTPVPTSAHSWALQGNPLTSPWGDLVSTLCRAVVSLESSAAVRGIKQGLHTGAEIDLKNTALRAKIKQQNEIWQVLVLSQALFCTNRETQAPLFPPLMYIVTTDSRGCLAERNTTM